MEKILTTDEKLYLRRVTNYVKSMGMQEGNIEIEMDNEGSIELKKINWDYVTHFENHYNADIPLGLIEILKRIVNYVYDNDLVTDIDVDAINYQKMEFTIDPETKTISFSHWWSYYDQSDSETMEYDSEEDITRFENWEQDLVFENITVGDDGVLTLKYNGGGDSGYIEGTFEENGDQVPTTIEDWVYGELERNFGGWEINEGSDGYVTFDFNSKIVTMNHIQNTEEHDQNTIYKESFTK